MADELNIEDVLSFTPQNSAAPVEDMLDPQTRAIINERNRKLDEQRTASKEVAPIATKDGWQTVPSRAALLSPPAESSSARAERINANTDDYGVKATVDEKGQLSLTNIGVTPKTPVYPTAASGLGAGPGTGAIAPNTPLSVNSLFNQLKSTTDVDTARGIAASLREAAAVQGAQFELGAQQFAENALGIPSLQKELQAAQAADLADPLYRPGMGDSPITAKIRNTLEDARIKANAQSKVYLQNNPQYAVLKSTLVSADSEIQRITRIGDRKQAIEDQSEIRARDRREARLDQLTEAAQGLDSTQRQRLLMLNPELGSTEADKLDARMMQTIQARKSDKAWVSAFQAPEEELPVLALNGNKYATDLVASKELANTGIDPTITRARLDRMRVTMSTPGAFKQGLEALYGNNKEGEARVKEALAAFNSKNLTPEGKQQANAMKYQLALDLAKKTTTKDFSESLGTWKVSDPLFQNALSQTRQVTGRTDMMDVLNTYLGQTTGPERVLKTQAFAELMTAEAQKSTNSIFGMPNYVNLRSQIFASQREGALRKWVQGLGNFFQNVPGAEQAGDPYASGNKAAKDAGEYVMGNTNTDPRIDPVTGAFN